MPLPDDDTAPPDSEGTDRAENAAIAGSTEPGGQAGQAQRVTRRAPLLDRLAERRSFRLRVALALAAISLVSAYVSHVASERDSTAAGLDALASEQWAEEQQAEQQIDALVAQDERLATDIDQHWQMYRGSLAQADAIRETDPDRAAQLDLIAQGSWAQFSQLWPFLRASQPDLTGEVGVYDADAARDTARLQDWRLFRASSELTREEARVAADAATATVLVVVILVTALFLLTLAHVAGGRRGVALAAAGVAASIGGIVWFTALGVRAAIPLLVAAVLVAMALIVVRIPRVHAWLRGMDHDDVLGDVAGVPTRTGTTASTDPNDRPTSRFNRYVAVVIAVATLLGAAVGYLHGQAASSSERQEWRAHDLGVEAIGALRAAEEHMAVDVEAYQQALAKHVDAWNAAQRGSYAAWVGDSADEQRMILDARQLEEAALLDERHSGLADELGPTGVSDPAVLRDLQADVWEASARLAALQDAANAASRMWGARAGLYLSVLAWLAVAAYLLGLSLIFRDRRVRTVLVSVGTLLILAAVVRSGTVWIEPEPTTPAEVEASADAYAAGYVALLRRDPGAEALFSTAIEDRADFGIASRERAQALLEIGSAPGLGIRAAFTEEAVDEAIEELNAARANRADTAGVILNLGAMLFHRSIQSGSMADMEQSLSYTRAGLELGASYEETHGAAHLNQQIGEMNLGLALLGTGDVAGAERAYRTAGQHIAGLPRYLQRYMVSAALTPLGLLEGAPEPPSEEDVLAMKELVVSTGYGVGTDSPARVTSTRVELFPSLLQWRATIPDFDPTRDELVVQWYRLDPVVDRWSALPLMSGQVTYGVVDLAGQFQADPTVGSDDYWGNTGAVLTDIPPACVRPGEYRVELYLNGRLHGSAEPQTTTEEYVPLLARDVGAAMCRPPDWTVSGTPGLATTTTAADGSRGIAIFRIHQPRGPAGSDPRIGALERVLDGALAGLPAGLLAGSELDAATQPTVFGFNNSVWRLHDYPGGTATMSATAMPGTGTVMVVCLYGPEDWVASEESRALLVSIIPH